MSDVSKSSKPRKPRRRYGPHEAAARMARIEAMKSPVWKQVRGLAQAACNFGRELDEWPHDDDGVPVPGRASMVREYNTALTALTKHLLEVPVAAESGLAAARALLKKGGDDVGG